MAQAIHCDREGHTDALADVMVTALANGETQAYCFPDFVEVARLIVRDADATREAAEAAAADELAAAEAAATDQAAAARLAEVQAPGRDELGVATFRPPGDESVQEGLGGPQADETPPPGPTDPDDGSGSPGPSSEPSEAVTALGRAE